MTDMGDDCMYGSAEVGAMMGTASTLPLDDEETEADRRVRQLREAILGKPAAAPPRRIGFV